MFNNFLDYEYQPYHKIYVHQPSNYGIYLGDVSAAMDMDFIQNEPIKLVVTAAKGMDQVSYPEGTVKHIIYPLLDAKTQNISQFFSDFYQLVEKQIYLGNILVHCAAGISRSATLVIAYCMKKNNLSFKQAIKLVRDIRPIVLPNLGFERQLKEFQTVLSKKPIRQPNTSQIDRKMLNDVNEGRTNLMSPSKVDILPDINHLGRTSWFKKGKPLEKNVQFRLNVQNMKDFQQRRFDIKTRKSQHDVKELRKKGNHYRNVNKQIIFAKMQNGRRKLLERSNNFVSANFLNQNSSNMIEETPSLSIKKLSSLSHRGEKRSLDRPIVKNYSSHKYEKDPNLLQQMGRIVVSKLQLNERRFVTEKQPRIKRSRQIAVKW